MYKVLKQLKCSLTVLSALFITVVTSRMRGSARCTSDVLGRCTQPLSVLTDSGLTFVSSKADLDKMCPDLKEAIRCIHGYTRHCMNPQERSHFRELFQGTGHMVHELCKNGTYQTEYLKYAPCMKQAEPQNEVCLKGYKSAMYKIESDSVEKQEEEDATVTGSEPDDKLRYQKRKREAADEGIKSVCCSFQQYAECSTHTMRRACGENAASFSQDFLDKMSSTLIKKHCAEYGHRECGILSSSSSRESISAFLVGLMSIVIYYLR